MNPITVYDCPICFDEHFISPFEAHHDDEVKILGYDCGECDNRHQSKEAAEACCVEQEPVEK